MNRTVLIVIVSLVFILGGYFLFRGGYQTPKELGVPAPGQQEVPESIVVPQGEVQELSMVSSNFFFSPKDIVSKKGEPVKITFQNSKIHTFTIDELKVNVSLQGNSPTVEFTPSKSGTFEYYCAIPGHRSNGMFGSITVE